MTALAHEPTCREVVEFLADYLDGTLAEDERGAFETHVRQCPECETYLRGYRDTIRLARAAARDPEGPVPPEVPDDLVEAILRARPERRSRGPSRQRRGH